VGLATGPYEQRSENTSALLRQLFERFRGEGLTMPFTMEDFQRQYVKEHFAQLTPEEKEEVLRSLPLEQRLAGLSEEQIRQYLAQLSPARPAAPCKQRQKK
jgi:small-conductance mechanosensitive channel